MRRLLFLLALCVLLVGGIFLWNVSRPSEAPADDAPVMAWPPEADTSAAGRAAQGPSSPSAPVQDVPPTPAPDLTLTTLDGEKIRLTDRRGQVTLVNFWATWCGPCRVEIPDLAALQDTLGEKGLLIVGVADRESAEVVRPFAERQDINYPLVADPDGTVSEAFGGVRALPTTFVIGPDGRIVQRVIGILPAQEVQARLAALLEDDKDA